MNGSSRPPGAPFDDFCVESDGAAGRPYRVCGRSSRLLRSLVPFALRPTTYLTRLVQRRTGRRVRAGPFAGMSYVDRAIGSAYIPKLLGIYERELHHVIDWECKRPFRRIINLGAGEGYYTVGLALRNPLAEVLAFEAELAGQAAIHQLAALNGVSRRVLVQARCERSDLAGALAGPQSAFVLCDVEGAELDLLDPQAVPELGRATLLVEVHEFITAGTAAELTRRFEGTHQVRQIWQEPRAVSDFPFRTWLTAALPRRFIEWAVSEWRPERMSWLWMLPTASPVMDLHAHTFAPSASR